MADISVNQMARSLGVTTVMDMAQKAGLSRPPPPISVRALARLIGLPLQPTDLRLFWDLDVAGRIVYRRPDEQGVPLNNVQFDWKDPAGTPIQKAKNWQFEIKDAATGRAFGNSPFGESLPGFGLSGFTENTRYSWNLVPSNDFGQGPGSQVFTFQTASAPAPPKPVIQVLYHPPPGSAQFSIKGTGFVSNHAVHVRGVNDADVLHPAFADTNSDNTGAISLQVSIPCVPGTKLSFSANDGRPDVHDLTGTLWSNTVTVTAS